MAGARNRLAGYLARSFRLPLVLIILLAGAVGAARMLEIGSGLQLARVWVALALGIAALVLQRIVSALLEWAARDTSTTTGTPTPLGHVLPLARRALNVAILLVGVMLVLDQLGVSISPLLAGLGISGIAVALALQPLLTNLFAGSYILSDSSIRVGDYIALQNGPGGRVESIGWRATRIRDLDTGTLIIIPNAALAAAIVTNYGIGQAVATVSISVARDSDLDAAERSAEQALRQVVAERPEAIPDQAPVVRFHGVSDDRVTLMLGLRTRTQADVAALRHEMLRRIVRELRGATVVAGDRAD